MRRLVRGALVLGALGTAPAVFAGGCPASDEMEIGQAPDWYRTAVPSEHFDSARSQRFPHSCTLQQITGSAGPYDIRVNVAEGHYPWIYNVVTRKRSQLYVFGGYPGEGDGAYIAKLHAGRMDEEWRVHVKLPSWQWNYIGAAGAHGNGFLYAVQNNVLSRVHPVSGAQTLLELPQIAQEDGGTGASYNGFVVTQDGLIVTKSMERGPCEAEGVQAIPCVARNDLPAQIVVVDPDTLTIVDRIAHDGASLGRIALERHGGVDYIYIPGLTALYRYSLSGGRLALDTSWGPVPYGRFGRYGGGLGIMGDWVVGQTNFMPDLVPSYLFAANIHDSGEAYSVQLFPPGGPSWVPDKAALDADTLTAYATDVYAEELVAVQLVPGEGLQVRWRQPSPTTGFPALLGPAGQRQLLAPYFVDGGDTLHWRDLADGETIASSAVLASDATFSASVQGFKGWFYYPSFQTGELVQLRIKAQ